MMARETTVGFCQLRIAEIDILVAVDTFQLAVSAYNLQISFLKTQLVLNSQCYHFNNVLCISQDYSRIFENLSPLQIVW